MVDINFAFARSHETQSKILHVQRLEQVFVHRDVSHAFQVAHEDAGCSVSGKFAALEAIFTCLDHSSTWRWSLKSSWTRGFPTKYVSLLVLSDHVYVLLRICNSLAKKDQQPLWTQKSSRATSQNQRTKLHFCSKRLWKMSFLCKNFKSLVPCFSSKKSRPPLPHHRRPMSERLCSLLLIALMTHLLQWKSATRCSFLDSWIPLPPKPTSNRHLAGLLKEDGKKANCEKTETYKKCIYRNTLKIRAGFEVDRCS